MHEQGPGREDRAIAFNRKQATERFAAELEGRGARIACILGPALALSGTAFAEEGREKHAQQLTENTCCEIAFTDNLGKKVGEGTIALPNLDTFPVENGTYRISLFGTGEATPHMTGFLTEGHKQPQKPQTLTIKERAMQLIEKIEDKGISETVPSGGTAYGWTFPVDTSHSALWHKHNADLVIAAVVPEEYGVKNIAKGKLPEEMGAFFQITVHPK